MYIRSYRSTLYPVLNPVLSKVKTIKYLFAEREPSHKIRFSNSKEMKNVKKSCCILLSVITILMVSVLTCYADGDPSVLLDEKFRNTYVPAGREDTHASGWAVSGDGGYITGRNSYDGFRMVDTDTDGNITMLKTLSSQSDGILTFESVLVFDDLTGNFEISLGNVNSDSLLLSFRQGKLYYKDAENDRFISDYIPSSRFGLRAEIDLTEGNTQSADSWNEDGRNNKEISAVTQVYLLNHLKTGNRNESVKCHANTAHYAVRD